MNAAFGSFGLLLAQVGEVTGRAHWGGPVGFFPLFPLVPLLWLALIGGLVWWLTRGGRLPGRSGLERAQEILAERYARGEVSSEEYRERVEHLRASAR